MADPGLWDVVGYFFLNIVSGNALIFGIGFLAILLIILILSKCSLDTIFMFMIFPTYALLSSGIFGGLVSKSAFFICLIYAGYKYFTYSVKLIGHMNG